MEMIELFVFLMQKEKTTCKEISERFCCSVRTAHRKVVNLSLVVPVVTVQGFGGGYQFCQNIKKNLSSV